MQLHVPGTVALLALAAPRVLLAQTPVAGTWIAEFAVRVQVVNGVESVEKGHARISLQVKGDSVQGVWQTLGSSGAASGDPRPLRGVLTNGGVQLETMTSRQVVMQTPAGEDRIQVHMIYALAARGDSLVGTEQWVAVDQSSKGPLRPFAATREKRS